MTAPAATCELFIDGVRVPDTGAELVNARVTALDGLTVSWGRDGPNEQPGPAVCEFDVIDPDAGDSFLDVVHVGSNVVVYATGHIAAGGQQTTYDNGSFVGLAGPVPANAATFLNAGTGTYASEALKLSPPATVTAPNYPAVIIPPRRFVTTGLPTAWDSIPKASAGEQWKVHVTVVAQAGVSYTVGLVAYASPTAGGYQSGFTYAMPGNAGVGTGGNQTYDLTATITALPVPAWLAIRVDFAGDPYIGGRWNEQTTAWNQETTRTWGTLAPFKFGLYVDDLALYPPTATARRVMVFNGNVSDIKITPDTETQISVKCTAADIGAELGNRIIGDDPWPKQTMITRANRIMTLAGLPLSNLRVDPPLDALQVSWRDVDAQPSYQMLQDLAQTVGGTLWTAIHVTTGSYMWVENPANRASVKQFSGNPTAPILDGTNFALNPLGPTGGALGWWVPSRGTLAAGTGYLRHTITDANPVSLAQRFNTPPTLSAPDKLVVKAGDIVRARLQVRSSQSFPMRVAVQFFDSSGAFLTSNDSAAVTTNPTTFVDLPEQAGTAPANATWSIVQIGIHGTGARAIGDTMDLRQVMITINGVPATPFFDGDTPAAGGYSYNWTGTPHASTSQRWIGGNTITISGGGSAKPLSACDILMEPVSWEQDTGDVITVVALTWLEQTVDDEGKPAPTDRTIIAQDDAAIATYGTRRLSYATELTSSADATALANRLLNTARTIGWRMDGVTLDTLNMPDEIDTVDDTTRASVFLDLLDGTIRMGYGVYLTDLPAYAPRGATTGAYVEGGRYTYAAGGWALELTVTPSGGQGKSATWQDMTRQPSWAWNQFDPSIRWVDCFGTMVP